MLKSDALIDLYCIDVGSTSTITDWPGPLYFVSPEQTDAQDVQYVNINGDIVTYTQKIVSAGGFEITGSNKLPQPKLTFTNVDGSMFAMNRAYDDLLGFRVIRIRTFRRFLRSIGGTNNSGYNANAHYTPEQWYVNRKMEESVVGCVYELASVFDVEGIRFPKRRMYSNYCPFAYKGPECQYDGNETSCPKTLEGCKERFGRNADLRYGGFPTASNT